MPKPSSDPQRQLSTLALSAVALFALHDAAAVEFSNDAGTLTGSWDTTVSYGQAWRIESRDCRLVATANGGCGRSPNIDDGNLNYDTDMYSSAFKAVTELSVNYKRVGAFVRASGFYDLETEDGPTARTPLSPTTRDLVGSYTRLLDAFAYARFDLGSMPGELRLGRQAVSWGESTFIQNGISVINHFDVAALRVPGSELKEGFLPQEMVNLSLQFNDRWSAQAIYITDWNSTIPEPAGSYFSANDFAVPGGEKVVLGFGRFSDQGVDFRPLGGTLIRDFQAVSRAADRRPDKNGQYGFNVKYFAQDFNNGTEFGAYFLNYHSRLPVISALTGTSAGVANAWGALNATSAAASLLGGGLPAAAAIAAGAQAGVAASRTNALRFVGDLSLAQATEYATIGARTALAGGGQAGVTRQARNLATHEYARTARYFIEYPEDIQMIGLSFNTQIQTGGIALQGEVTYRKDVPLQYDDIELLFAALTPFEAGLGLLTTPGVPVGTPITAFPVRPCSATALLNDCNQIGRLDVAQEIQGWGLHDTWQAQFTATKTFTNVLKAAQLVVVLESAVSHVVDLPNKVSGGPVGRGLRYNGPGTSVSGNAELAGRFHFNEVEPLDRFADATSWGYRFAGRFEYPGLMGPWNVVPRFSWQHDVSGTTPGPGGNFVEGRYGLTLGVSTNLQARWEVDFAWTTFGGAGRFNDINDRDFIATSVKYAF